MDMTDYNTNLAGEFYVLSALHRKGIDAYLTLGNKKACDIVAIRADRTSVSVEVKTVAGQHDWRVGNLETEHPNSHFVGLVSFEGNISDTTRSPAVWIVPFTKLPPFLRVYEGATNVSRAEILKSGQIYANAWGFVSGEI